MGRTQVRMDIHPSPLLFPFSPPAIWNLDMCIYIYLIHVHVHLPYTCTTCFKENLFYRMPEFEQESGVPIQLLDKTFSSNVTPVRICTFLSSSSSSSSSSFTSSSFSSSFSSSSYFHSPHFTFHFFIINRKVFKLFSPS